MDSFFVGKPLPPPKATTMKELNDRRFKEFAALKLKEEPIDEPADNLYVRFAPPPPPKTSSRFNAQDAEITVLSSDNVLFRLHKANARVTSGGLLPSQSSGTEDAFLTLPEPAEILEILFEFLYPDYETDLERLEFSALLQVAEAAEKYVVFYAMNHCTFCLRKHTLFHSSELISFAVKYGKEKMLSELTPALLDMELEEVITILSPTAFGEFCLYRDKWTQVLFKCCSLTLEWSVKHEQNRNCPCAKDPEAQVARKLKNFLDGAIAKPSLLGLDRLDRTLFQLEAILGGTGCGWCKDALITFKDAVMEQIKGIPQKFVVELD